MKKVKLLAFVVALALFAGCRSDEMREFDSNYAEINSDPCMNGVQDGSETGVDCGGGCGLCNSVNIPCTLAPNELYVDGVLKTYSFSSTFSDEIVLYYSGGFSLTMQFVSGGVDPGFIYPCTSSMPSSSNVRVYADFGTEFWYYSGSSQKLYLEGTQTNLSVSFCDLELTSNITGEVHTIQGNKSDI